MFVFLIEAIDFFAICPVLHDRGENLKFRRTQQQPNFFSIV